MKIGILKERDPHEMRVAGIPDSISRLTNIGFEILIEKTAGENSGYSDIQLQEAGAKIVETPNEIIANADLFLVVNPPPVELFSALKSGSYVIGMLAPAQNKDFIRLLCDKESTGFSLEFLPRISRAQSMDVLSSQATASGYVGALTAANNLFKFFPMFITAAGTVRPAKVFVIGAGVAGLQAIATCKRLGASVKAYDVRLAAEDEVKSLGAVFVKFKLEAQEGEGGYAKEQSEEFLRRQQELMKDEIRQSDIVITTAAIPNRRAPLIVTKEMVEEMQPGSVIVDLAAESGGNCELSKPGETVIHNGVKVIGARNYPSKVANHSSFLYARNLFEFVNLLTKESSFQPDFDDEIVKATSIVKDGKIVNEVVKQLVNG